MWRKSPAVKSFRPKFSAAVMSINDQSVLLPGFGSQKVVGYVFAVGVVVTWTCLSQNSGSAPDYVNRKQITGKV